MIYEHLVDERDGRYIVHGWASPDLAEWNYRQAVAAADMDAAFGVGDICQKEFREGRTSASPEVAEQIRAEHDRFRARIRTYAAEYDVDIEHALETLADGAILLIALPPGQQTDFVRTASRVHVCPAGLIPEGANSCLDFAHLINASRTGLRPGMTFDVMELDSMVMGIRFDALRTAEIQQERATVQLLQDLARIVSMNDGVRAAADLDPPFYVDIRNFDDGQYYANLYDSGSGSHSTTGPAVRRVADASVTTPRVVKQTWVEADLVPVSEIHLAPESHPDAPVGYIDPEVEPMDLDTVTQ